MPLRWTVARLWDQLPALNGQGMIRSGSDPPPSGIVRDTLVDRCPREWEIVAQVRRR